MSGNLHYLRDIVSEETKKKKTENELKIPVSKLPPPGFGNESVKGNVFTNFLKYESTNFDHYKLKARKISDHIIKKLYKHEYNYRYVKSSDYPLRSNTYEYITKYHSIYIYITINIYEILVSLNISEQMKMLYGSIDTIIDDNVLHFLKKELLDNGFPDDMIMKRNPNSLELYIKDDNF